MGRRSERLLMLMQALRRRRRPVAGQVLAAEMGVSLRSLYRDIETLKSMGAAIDGEAGLGFQLSADYFMPPLMFSEEEVEALVLGLRTLIYGPDADMAATARDATAKIAAVLPAERRAEMDAVGLFAMPRTAGEAQQPLLADLRRAIREERQVRLAYCDLEGETTVRVIYPVALGYYEDRQVLSPGARSAPTTGASASTAWAPPRCSTPACRSPGGPCCTAGAWPTTFPT